MTDFTNTHLSYSRLARFEQCPLSFKLHYVDGLRAEPGVPLRFGKAVHAVLEDLVREHVIDRVDRLGDDSIEVVDYKTNRALFSHDDLATSLQLGLYGLAAKQLWPWAREIKLSYQMLRHGLRLSTSRTDEELQAVLSYVETLGRMTEQATDFPPRLNSNCVYCDHRRQCPAYEEALRGQVHHVCQDMDDVDAVSRERQELAHITKILWARKAELEGVLKAHLHECDELTAGGVRYRMLKTARLKYPLERTVNLLAGATGQPKEQLLRRLAVADKRAVEEQVKKLAKELPRPQVRLFKAELDALAQKSWSVRLLGKAANKRVA